MADDERHAEGGQSPDGRTSMGQGANEAFATAWFLAAVPASPGDRPAPPGDRREAADDTPPGVIISVSLDELDSLSGDLLV